MQSLRARLRSLPRPSTAISVTALCLALAGTATAAAVIDGGDVKNNSLTGKDVRNKSLTKKDFRGSVRGPRGPQGQKGATGTTGPQGVCTTGPQGPSDSGFNAIEFAVPLVLTDQYQTVITAQIPAGEYPGAGENLLANGEAVGTHAATGSGARFQCALFVGDGVAFSQFSPTGESQPLAGQPTTMGLTGGLIGSASPPSNQQIAVRCKQSPGPGGSVSANVINGASVSFIVAGQ